MTPDSTVQDNFSDWSQVTKKAIEMAYKKFENSLSQDIHVMNVIVLKYPMRLRS